MALSAFDDKAHPPTDEQVQVVLGRSGDRWTQLKEELQAAYGPLEEKWGYPGAKYGWSLALKNKKRALIYLGPRQKHFTASTALGDKAARLGLDSDLPDTGKALIRDAQKFPEGRAFRIEVRTKKDVAVALAVVGFKMAT